MRLVVGVLIALIVGGAARAEAGGCPEDEATLHTTLQARYDALKVAMESREIANVTALLSPDFRSLDISGQPKDATAMLREVSALPKDPAKVSGTTLLVVQVVDAAAVVQQRYEMQTVKTTAAGEKQHISLTALSTDRWICSDAVWRLQQTETDQLDLSVDGKSVLHKARNPGP